MKCCQILFDMDCNSCISPSLLMQLQLDSVLPESSSGVFYLNTLYLIKSSWIVHTVRKDEKYEDVHLNPVPTNVVRNTVTYAQEQNTKTGWFGRYHWPQFGAVLLQPYFLQNCISGTGGHRLTQSVIGIHSQHRLGQTGERLLQKHVDFIQALQFPLTS